MLIAASLVASTLGPWFGTPFPRMGNPPPKPYTEQVKLPGKTPSGAEDLLGAWQYGYSLDDAKLEEGQRALYVTVMLDLKEEGTYRLFYNVRWGAPGGSIAKGFNVEETGNYTLSGEILLLGPKHTRKTDIEFSAVTKSREIPSEKHVWVVHAEKTKLHAAGRCATYQLDPVCKSSPNIWFSMKAEKGRNWFGL